MQGKLNIVSGCGALGLAEGLTVEMREGFTLGLVRWIDIGIGEMD